MSTSVIIKRLDECKVGDRVRLTDAHPTRAGQIFLVSERIDRGDLQNFAGFTPGVWCFPTFSDHRVPLYGGTLVEVLPRTPVIDPSEALEAKNREALIEVFIRNGFRRDLKGRMDDIELDEADYDVLFKKWFETFGYITSD
jgi:hypothetical protein